MKQIITIALVIFVFFTAISQQSETIKFRYISPLPGSSHIMPQNNIALRHGDVLNTENLKSFQVEVRGSKQGKITGQMVLSSNGRTVIFKPNHPFQKGERVYVNTHGNLTTAKGIGIEPVSFWFDVAEVLPQLPADYFQQKDLDLAAMLQKPSPLPQQKQVKDNNLPDDFPELTVNFSDNPNETECYFISSHGSYGYFEDAVPYNIIFDHMGVPVYYEKLVGNGYDFKLQPDGTLSFFLNDWPAANHLVYDSSYQHIDTYLMGNGYGNTDFHEFLLLPDEHAIVMTYDPQLVDMSQVVPGGHPNAIVSGWIIQELDADKNVIFQWRSWDHYEITDCDEHVNLLDSIIDYTHGNSIELVGDDAMLLSPRNFNEVTKIDRNTGDIIWRLGGENNMFTFTNDTLRFSRAHDVRMLDNGNMSLFDNGSYHPDPKFSSVIEYEVDEENMEVTLIRRLRSEPDIFGVIMGDARERPDGDMVTGWGSGVPGLTVFNADNDISLEVYFAGINYRAFRFPWQTNLFSCDTDTLHFGYLWYEESLTKSFTVNNPGSDPLELTSFYTNNNDFMVDTGFPLTIPANSSTTITVTLAPDAPGTYKDVLTLNSDINTEDLTRRVAQQVNLVGYATQGQSVDDLNNYQVRVFPNPVSDELIIKLDDHQDLEMAVISNIQGEHVRTFKVNGKNKITVDVSDLAAGIYSLQFLSREGSITIRSKFIKH